MSFSVNMFVFRVIGLVTTLHSPSAEFVGTEGSRAEPFPKDLVQCSDCHRWDFANLYKGVLSGIRRYEAIVLYSLHHLSCLANRMRFHRAVWLV